MGKKKDIPDDTPGKTVGWRNGSGLNAVDVRKHLKESLNAKTHYNKVVKALEKGQRSQVNDPLKNLPPQWQSFYSTVPHLNARNSYKEYTRIQENKDAEKEFKDGFDDGSDLDLHETINSENAKLEKEKRKKEEELRKVFSVIHGWEKKIRRMESKKHQQQEFQRFQDNLDYWRREHSIWCARLASSKTYFDQREKEAEVRDIEQHQVLVRTTAQLDQDIHELKEEVVMLAEELQRVREQKELAVAVGTASAASPGSAVPEGGSSRAPSER